MSYKTIFKGFDYLDIFQSLIEEFGFSFPSPDDLRNDLGQFTEIYSLYALFGIYPYNISQQIIDYSPTERYVADNPELTSKSDITKYVPEVVRLRDFYQGEFLLKNRRDITLDKCRMSARFLLEISKDQLNDLVYNVLSQGAEMQHDAREACDEFVDIIWVRRSLILDYFGYPKDVDGNYSLPSQYVDGDGKFINPEVFSSRLGCHKGDFSRFVQPPEHLQGDEAEIERKVSEMIEDLHPRLQVLFKSSFIKSAISAALGGSREHEKLVGLDNIFSGTNPNSEAQFICASILPYDQAITGFYKGNVALGFRANPKSVYSVAEEDISSEYRNGRMKSMLSNRDAYTNRNMGWKFRGQDFANAEGMPDLEAIFKLIEPKITETLYSEVNTSLGVKEPMCLLVLHGKNIDNSMEEGLLAQLFLRYRYGIYFPLFHYQPVEHQGVNGEVTYENKHTLIDPQSIQVKRPEYVNAINHYRALIEERKQRQPGSASWAERVREVNSSLTVQQSTI